MSETKHGGDLYREGRTAIDSIAPLMNLALSVDSFFGDKGLWLGFEINVSKLFLTPPLQFFTNFQYFFNTTNFQDLITTINV